MGSILAAAFQDQDTLHGRAKLLDAFEAGAAKRLRCGNLCISGTPGAAGPPG